MVIWSLELVKIDSMQEKKQQAIPALRHNVQYVLIDEKNSNVAVELSEEMSKTEIERVVLESWQQHVWSSGMIRPCHGRDPSPILGTCTRQPFSHKKLMFWSKQLALTIGSEKASAYLLLVVQELLMSLCGELKVGPLNNCIHRACLL